MTWEKQKHRAKAAENLQGCCGMKRTLPSESKWKIPTSAEGTRNQDHLYLQGDTIEVFIKPLKAKLLLGALRNTQQPENRLFLPVAGLSLPAKLCKAKKRNHRLHKNFRYVERLEKKGHGLEYDHENTTCHADPVRTGIQDRRMVHHDWTAKLLRIFTAQRIEFRTETLLPGLPSL